MTRARIKTLVPCIAITLLGIWLAGCQNAALTVTASSSESRQVHRKSVASRQAAGQWAETLVTGNIAPRVGLLILDPDINISDLEKICDAVAEQGVPQVTIKSGASTATIEFAAADNREGHWQYLFSERASADQSIVRSNLSYRLISISYPGYGSVDQRFQIARETVLQKLVSARDLHDRVVIRLHIAPEAGSANPEPLLALLASISDHGAKALIDWSAIH